MECYAPEKGGDIKCSILLTNLVFMYIKGIPVQNLFKYRE